jgi:hypothetical protein
MYGDEMQKKAMKAKTGARLIACLGGGAHSQRCHAAYRRPTVLALLPPGYASTKSVAVRALTPER